MGLWVWSVLGQKFPRTLWVSHVCRSDLLHQTRGFSTGIFWVTPFMFLSSEMPEGKHESRPNVFDDWLIIYEWTCMTEHVNLWLFPCVHAKSLQLCLIIFDPTDCSPPGFSVHGILQAKILEWVTELSSRGSSRPRDRTHISCMQGSPDSPQALAKIVQPHPWLSLRSTLSCQWIF